MNKKVIKGTAYRIQGHSPLFLGFSDGDIRITLLTKRVELRILDYHYRVNFKTLSDVLQYPELLSKVLDYPGQPHKFELPLEVREILFNEELEKELNYG